MNEFFKGVAPYPIMGQSYSLSDFKEIKLNDILVSEGTSFNSALKMYCNLHGVKLLYGGYLEKREIYNEFDLFQTETTRRNIHLGVDVWAPEDHKIFLPIEGVVHSFKDNKEPGSYGPTIIIQHSYKGETFFTLYGHLSRSSLDEHYAGKLIEKGTSFASLGDSKVNGGYAPHLHFQVIKNVENYYGDFPGVCSEEELESYKACCPNPLDLINFN